MKKSTRCYLKTDEKKRVYYVSCELDSLFELVNSDGHTVYVKAEDVEFILDTYTCELKITSEVNGSTITDTDTSSSYETIKCCSRFKTYVLELTRRHNCSGKVNISASIEHNGEFIEGIQRKYIINEDFTNMTIA